MKFDNLKLDDEFKQEIVKMLEDAPANQKSEVLYQAAVKVSERMHSDLIEQLKLENAQAAADNSYMEKMGVHVLSKEETEFYEFICDPQQTLTMKQIDIIPHTVIDRTIADVKKASDILSLINFAPAGVAKWLAGSHSGKAVWGALDAAITGELSAELSSLDLESRKLTVFLPIPKAIKDLALPFVDKYFTAILGEAIQDGLVTGYLNGNGKTAPVGIMNQIETFKGDGTADAKEVETTITGFSPKQLAPVRKKLTNGGKRVVSELELICNPLDEAEYVDPALFGEALTGGYRNVSFMPINKHVDANCPQGKAIFTVAKAYTLGISKIDIKEYDQTKAMEDANVAIGKVYANGRADDDNVAVVFNVQKLKEYVLPVTQATAPVEVASVMAEEITTEPKEEKAASKK